METAVKSRLNAGEDLVKHTKPTVPINDVINNKLDSTNTNNDIDKMDADMDTNEASDDTKSETSQDQLTTTTTITTTTNCDNNLSPSIVMESTTTTTPILNEKHTDNIVVPDTILSPPKSDATQTDETNTASPSSASTSNSTSPASATQMSPIQNEAELPKEQEQEEPTEKSPGKTTQKKPIVANGTVAKSGKPLASTMNKKINNKTTRAPRVKKTKAAVVTTMYESEISDHKVGIKLCIKKSDTSNESPKTQTSASKPETTSATAAASSAVTPTASKPIRKRSRKSKTRPQPDSEAGETEPKRKPGDKQKKQISFSSDTVDKDDHKRPQVEQSDWGARLPEEVLFKIFKMVVNRDGCLPTLFRLGRVCSLWRRVSLSPLLWHTLDLTTWIKEKYRTELKLKWFVDNRCSHCTELNIASWKVSDIDCFLAKLSAGCPNLTSITLSGWKQFNCDHLSYLVENQKKLARLDLSSVNVEMNISKSAVGVQSLCNALQTMGERLTHLYLASNRLAGIPLIVNVLAKHCPNLLLLDLSNVTTQATSHGILHIEKLQHGCQKLKVLRVTNSHVTLSTATMQEQMDSPGFPDLEELSVAALTQESRIIGDEHLQRILKTSSKLKLLDVRGCMRLTHESLIRLPAWDIKHLFLSGCSITRDVGSGLELIASKWAHSLIELDLAWANVQQPLDNALRALAEKAAESPLAHLNLCGSSVSEEAVKEILAYCPQMSSINLASCRGLPRGVKRLMQGSELHELRDVLKVQLKVKLANAIDSASVETNASEQQRQAVLDGKSNNQ